MKNILSKEQQRKRDEAFFLANDDPFKPEPFSNILWGLLGMLLIFIALAVVVGEVIGVETVGEWIYKVVN